MPDASLPVDRPSGPVHGPDHVDVLIVGAGLSGIGAAYHLQTDSPDRTYVILEGREAIGGTWDLFRYPGIRSDSDMYTLGYNFKPWREAKAIADGPSILNYVRETARENGIDRHIRFGHKVTGAEWSSADQRWTVEAARTSDGAKVRFTANFVMLCCGYYDYAQGHDPGFQGVERFKGRLVHPQFWPSDLDYRGKRVVVIGSGATAVTVVPEMAKDAAHVVMLQRSPTYVASVPGEDRIANWLRRNLPAKLAYALARWKNVLFQMFFFNLAQSRPEKVKRQLVGLVRKELGAGYDVATHFTPRYNPWDERLCAVPDGDLFAAIREGRASVVTDHIDTFTEEGIRLKSGKVLEADIVVQATGLKLTPVGGVALSVDGKPVEIPKTFVYKGMMYSDVPNLAAVFGYTNASWTLKADLTCEYVCRLLNHMRQTGMTQCTPRLSDPEVREEPFLPLKSGYVQRAMAQFPRQGSKRPWKLYQNYALDLVTLKLGKLDDGALVFSRGAPAPAVERPLAQAAE